jgi:hypothetical protein
MNTRSVTRTERGWGDAAVDGLLVGVGAGGLMAIYLVVAGVAGGASWLEMLANFDPGAEPRPLTGALT